LALRDFAMFVKSSRARGANEKYHPKLPLFTRSISICP